MVRKHDHKTNAKKSDDPKLQMLTEIETKSVVGGLFDIYSSWLTYQSRTFNNMHQGAMNSIRNIRA